MRILRHRHELAAIGDAWDNLALRVCDRLPRVSYSWVAGHLDAEGREAGSWVCLAAYDGDRLIGVWPIGLRRVSVLGRRVVLLGQPGKQRAHSVDVVIWPGREAEVFRAFAACLEEIAPRWFGLEEFWVDDRSPLVQRPVGPLSEYSIVRHPVGVTSVISSVESWEAYSGRLNGKFRRELKRFRRRLAEQAEVEVEFFSGAEASAEHLERFLRLEASGWKGEAGSAVAEQPRLRRLYSDYVTRLHRSGMLEWHFLRAGDQDIAGHLATRSGRSLYLHRIGYDEAWSRYSPGVLLMEQALTRAFGDPSIEEINFFTQRKWLEPWRPDKRPYYHVWVYPRRPRSLIAGAWPKQVRQALRRVPAVRRLSRLLRGEVIEGSPIQSRRDFLRRQAETGDR